MLSHNCAFCGAGIDLGAENGTVIRRYAFCDDCSDEYDDKELVEGAKEGPETMETP